MPGSYHRRRDVIRRCLVIGVVGLLASAASGRSVGAECWRPPVSAPISDPFRRPSCRWCPGNRGIEFATTPNSTVRAVAAGVVTYSGVVAGTRYVVVEHANGWRATYGRLSDTDVRRGDLVVARSVIGTSSARLHFGLRDGRRYLDPSPYLGRLVHATRLLPLDGSPPAPAGSPQLRCERGPATSRGAVGRS